MLIHINRIVRPCIGSVLIALLVYPWAWAQTSLLEQPLNQTPMDVGDITPTRYIKAHITNQTGHYILGPGDVVEVKVKDLADFDQKFMIRPDGQASIHPFGEYQVAGIDVNGLELWMEERFKKYLLKPEVTVSVNELRPAVIYVLGAVQRPGTYQFVRKGLTNAIRQDEQKENADITISSVLSQAGGLRDTADIEHISVVHSITQTQESFDLNRFIRQGQGEDIVLMPGDKVFVPVADKPMDAETFRLISQSTFHQTNLPVVVLGAVQKQGEVQVSVNNNTLNSAIALAGGFTSVSKKDVIVVQRLNAQGRMDQFVINRASDPFQLRAGDMVYVADSRLSKVEHVLKFVSSLGQMFFFGASGLQSVRNIKLLNEQIKSLEAVNGTGD